MSTNQFNRWLNLDGTENYKCRAWVRINASSGTPAIVAAGNVSSITDLGVGAFRLNFTTVFADANYCAVGSAGASAIGTLNGSVRIGDGGFSLLTTAALDIRTTTNGDGAYADLERINVVIYR